MNCARDMTAALPLHPVERQFHLSVLALACVLFVCGLTLADPDIWGHTLYGIRAIDQGVLAESFDPFSYTAPGAVWINHEWLTEYVYGALWLHFGDIGLVMWRNGIMAALFGLFVYRLRKPGVTLAAAAVLLVFNAECLSEFVVFVRPQLATFLFFGVVLFILRRDWDGRNSGWLWCLPLMTALWTNLHGGFLAGLGVQALFAAGWAWRAWRSEVCRSGFVRTVAVFLLSGVCTLVNPYGWGLHRMLWEHLATKQLVREWEPLWNVAFTPVYMVPFVLAGLAFGLSRRWKWIDFWILMVVGFQAVCHLRHVALFSIATMLLLPESLSESLNRLFSGVIRQWSAANWRWRRVLATLSVAGGLLAIGLVGVVPIWRAGISPLHMAVETRSRAPGVPRQAVKFLQSRHLRGNLLTDYGWAQFALWELGPQTRIAFDGRYRTIYSAAIEEAFVEFQTLDPNSRPPVQLLDQFPTDIVLLPTGSGPTRYLATRPEWARVYADTQAEVFVKAQSGIQNTGKPTPSSDGMRMTPARWAPFPDRNNVTFR